MDDDEVCDPLNWAAIPRLDDDGYVMRLFLQRAISCIVDQHGNPVQSEPTNDIERARRKRKQT